MGYEKKQAKFECIVPKDVSKVMWYRGSDIITPSPKYEIIDDGKKHMLIINSCEFDDESQYSIEVLGQKSSAQLTVEGKYWTAAQERSYKPHSVWCRRWAQHQPVVCQHHVFQE